MVAPRQIHELELLYNSNPYPHEVHVIPPVELMVAFKQATVAIQ